jgi:hypothetical protein
MTTMAPRGGDQSPDKPELHTAVTVTVTGPAGGCSRWLSPRAAPGQSG